MIRRPPRSTQSRSSAASDVYKRQPGHLSGARHDHPGGPRMTKVVTIVGTRPEIIRLSRVMARLDETVEHVLLHTGQNYDYELNGIFFAMMHAIELLVSPRIRTASGRSFRRTSSVLMRISPSSRPRLVVLTPR